MFVLLPRESSKVRPVPLEDMANDKVTGYYSKGLNNNGVQKGSFKLWAQKL